ncbi:DUF1835 domain-containing protein [Psychroserpens jangbogonensis]|uniref:DUF1835 domain-containing protein n=1 Tax=Psychroserpens jangbogonensis TaxID=1484460 RepID=UPI00053ECB6B|nr:DUF1835 domain-containing protein [Psychroserpens jangbogonensis]
MNKTLHITNGNSLTDLLIELEIKGDFLTWQEMLCEGPTLAHIDSEEFIEVRKQFLSDFYNIEINEDEYKTELNKLNNVDCYTEIVLWFEYDLFCHINLLGVMSLLHQKGITLPLYLVCSGRIEGEKNLKGLSELSPEQLYEHYDNRIELTEKDNELAISLWRTYCGKDHNLFKRYIVQKSSFEYLSNCLKAHLRRFPDSRSGLSVLEKNILEIVRDNDIKSKHHLLGYILNYQGFYGYGDLQLERMIEQLSLFFEENADQLKLNRKGHESLVKIHNFSIEINNNTTYGGLNRLDFQFNKDENKLVKTNINVH